MTKGLQRSLARGDQVALAVLVGDALELGGVDLQMKKVTITVALSIDSDAISTAKGFGSVVLGALPEGNIIIHGINAQLVFQGPITSELSDTYDGDWAIGSTPMSDVTISAGDEDIITETALGAATAEASPQQTVNEIPAAILDNTAANLELNLNLLIDAADQDDDTTIAIAVTGTVVYTYSVLGDD